MSLLTPRDREHILEQLQRAPDSVLADAMLAFNAIREKVVLVRKMTEREAAPVEAAQTPEEVLLASITKITSATKDELLKLLWERGEVEFDGKDWYV